jgi:hypothetical protein
MEHIFIGPMRGKIINDYGLGIGLRKLASKYHVRHTKIRQVLVDNGVSIREPPRSSRGCPRNVKEHPRKTSAELPNEIRSYWVGYIVSRGYFLERDYRIQIRVPLIDIGHLFVLVKDFCLNKVPVRRGSYADLTIYSKDLFVSLRGDGGLIMRDWVRGLFDGHGSVIPGRFLRIRYRNRDSRVLSVVRDFCACGYVSGDYYCVNGGAAVGLGRFLYCNSVRYLRRKAFVVFGFIDYQK